VGSDNSAPTWDARRHAVPWEGSKLNSEGIYLREPPGETSRKGRGHQSKAGQPIIGPISTGTGHTKLAFQEKLVNRRDEGKRGSAKRRKKIQGEIKGGKSSALRSHMSRQ